MCLSKKGITEITSQVVKAAKEDTVIIRATRKERIYLKRENVFEWHVLEIFFLK